NYGTHAADVVRLAERETALARCFTGSHVSLAEAVYAIRFEMAQRMTDVVFRRTELGTAGHPGAAALDELQALMSKELEWSEQRTANERELVEQPLHRSLAEPRDAAKHALPSGPQALQQQRRA